MMQQSKDEPYTKHVPSLRFPEFKGEWEEKRLGEVASSQKYSFTGGPFGSDLKASDYTKQGVRIIQLQNIGDGTFHNDNKIYTSEEKANQLYSCNIFPNDILISKMGDPVARAVIVPNFEKRYIMSSDGIRLDVNKNKYYRLFIYQQINNKIFRQQAFVNSTGTTRRRIGLVDLRNLKLKLPPLPEQQKIADFLTAVDQRIHLLEHKHKLLKDYKKGVMQQIFAQKLRFTDEQGHAYPDWEEKKLGEVLSIFPTKKNYQVKKDNILERGKYKVINQGKNKVAGFSNETEKLLRIKEVIVYGDHTTFVKYINFDCIIGSDGIKLLTNNSESLKYLFYNLFYNNIEPEGYKRHFSILKNITLQIPTLPEQQKIADFLTAIDTKIEHTHNQLEKTKLFKKALLQQMFV